ncbi:MAG: hypothetical protein LH474_09570 [Chamaesiphon sp.]|nr:hypothetical protein [Chamaesiphon sp.]
MESTVEQIVAVKTTKPIASRTSSVQIAINPNSDPQSLRKIATSTDWELRRLVASNPNTPTDILWQLGLDFPEAILSNPIFQLLQFEQLQLAAEVPHATLTSLLQCEQVPKNFMDYAVSQQDYSLWLAVAYNAHTPSQLLENLARKSRHQDRELIRAIAAHPNTPHHLLAEIIKIGGGVAQVVAENNQTPIDVLEQILRKYSQVDDATFVTLVALHPQITPQLLIQMHLAPNKSAAQSLWLAKQSGTNSSELIELAQTEWEPLQLAVVRHQNTPSSTIEQVWKKIRAQHDHPSQIDRLMYDSFASNPNTSARIRDELRKLLQW